MYYSRIYRGSEFTLVVRILSAFTVIEERQLRIFFRRLRTGNYGKVVSRLKREGLIRFSENGRYVIGSGFAPENDRKRDSVLVFWSFIHLWERIEDFCGADPPSIVSFLSAGKDFDLLPGTPRNIPAINQQADTILESTVRFIATGDLKDLAELQLRPANDYLILVDSDGSCTTYHPKEETWKIQNTSK